jgi:hypothetical protein
LDGVALARGVPSRRAQVTPHAVHEIPIRLARPERATRLEREYVRCGVPLPDGLVDDVRRCRVRSAGETTPAQLTVLGRWPNGTIKWLFVEFTATAGESWFLVIDERPSADKESAGALASQAGRLVLRTGDLSVWVDDSIKILNGDQPCAAIDVRADLDGSAAATIAWTGASLEWNGPQRATALLSGAGGTAQDVVSVELRITTYAATNAIRFDLTIQNARRASHPGNLWELGDPGSIFIRDVSISLRPICDDQPRILWAGDIADDWRRSNDEVVVYQESSGGPSWNGPVHRDRSGDVPMRFRGGVVRHDGVEDRYDRAQPRVGLDGSRGTWTGGVLRFWEEFPTAVAAGNGRIRLAPFPSEFPTVHEFQGGEGKTRTCVLVHGDAASGRATLEQFVRPAIAVCDPDACRASDVLPFVGAPSDPRQDRVLATAIEGDEAFAAKRERADEYGWRHYGDLPADHESAFAGGAVLVSHYNNQYDPIAGCAFQFLRTGETRWWDLFDSLANHVQDIDVYHTDEDKPAYNRGLFWHTYHYVDAGLSSHRSYPRADGVSGGGPSAEHNYNAGLALHYYLTGSISSRNAAIALGQWVIDMDDGSRTPFRWFARSHTGLASASGVATYHGPGRASGNSISALLVAFELSGKRSFLDKAEALIRRCVHPEDDLEGLNLLDAERRWYYTVFLESLGRYLYVKHGGGELDGMYGYARAALLHYAAWMRGHEYPYLDKPEILEYPTETWSAQDIRKSDIFAWAALCTSGTEREAYLQAARRFFDDVFTRLPSLSTWRFTRPLVLLLWRGYGLGWVLAHPEASLPSRAGEREWPAKTRFEGQKVVAVRRAMFVASALAMLMVAVAAWILLKAVGR